MSWIVSYYKAACEVILHSLCPVKGKAMSTRRNYIIKQEGDRILQNLASSPDYTTETTTAIARYLLLTNRKFFCAGELREIKLKNLGCGVQEIKSVLAS